MKSDDILNIIKIAGIVAGGYVIYKTGSAIVQKVKAGADVIGAAKTAIIETVQETAAAVKKTAKDTTRKMAGEYVVDSTPDQSAAETARLSNHAKFLRQVEEWKAQKELQDNAGSAGQNYFDTTGAGSAG